MPETTYKIEYLTKTQNDSEITFLSGFLPQILDTIFIDGFHYKVVCIEYNNDHKTKPVMYVNTLT